MGNKQLEIILSLNLQLAAPAHHEGQGRKGLLTRDRLARLEGLGAAERPAIVDQDAAVQENRDYDQLQSPSQSSLKVCHALSTLIKIRMRQRALMSKHGLRAPPQFRNGPTSTCIFRHFSFFHQGK